MLPTELYLLPRDFSVIEHAFAVTFLRHEGVMLLVKNGMEKKLSITSHDGVSIEYSVLRGVRDHE